MNSIHTYFSLLLFFISIFCNATLTHSDPDAINGLAIAQACGQVYKFKHDNLTIYTTNNALANAMIKWTVNSSKKKDEVRCLIIKRYKNDANGVACRVQDAREIYNFLKMKYKEKTLKFEE